MFLKYCFLNKAIMLNAYKTHSNYIILGSVCQCLCVGFTLSTYKAFQPSLCSNQRKCFCKSHVVNFYSVYEFSDALYMCVCVYVIYMISLCKEEFTNLHF